MGPEQARQFRKRQIVNGSGAADLSRAGMSDEQAWREQAKFEMAMGMRCHGCGRRVLIGAQFVQIDVTDPERPAVHRTACTRDDCDFAEQARDGATAMKMIEYAWLDPLGPDAPAFGLGAHPADAPDVDTGGSGKS